MRRAASQSLLKQDVEGPKVVIRATPEKARDNEKVTVVVDASDPSGIKTVKVTQRGIAVSGSPWEQPLFMQAYEDSFSTSFHREIESAVPKNTDGDGSPRVCRRLFKRVFH